MHIYFPGWAGLRPQAPGLEFISPPPNPGSRRPAPRCAREEPADCRPHRRVPRGALLRERPVRYAVRAGSCGAIPAPAARA
jgi:hypothetical protein